MQTTDKTLHAGAFRVDYTIASQSDPSISVSAFFDVTFVSACATTNILLSPTVP